jgi:hypothetical protein
MATMKRRLLRAESYLRQNYMPLGELLRVVGALRYACELHCRPETREALLGEIDHVTDLMIRGDWNAIHKKALTSR